MSNSMFQRVKYALAHAGDSADYEHAKLLAEDCTPHEQLALIDSFKEARSRLKSEGYHVP